jgi:hypothetical protein
MQLEAVDSSLISHRGYDPAKRVMHLRFLDKRYTFGALYEFGNISPDMWEQALTWRNDNENSPDFGDLSTGQWFIRHIKGNKNHPFKKIEDPHNDLSPSGLLENLQKSVDETTDFASGQPLPVEESLPEDIEELGAKALALQERARAIVINSAEAYSIAETTGVAIARMRDALERTMRPKIKEAYTPYKALLEILNKYDGPLESDQKRLTAGMSAFKRAEDARVRLLADQERSRLQRIADDEARARAEALKKADVQAALDAGETKLAKQIEKAPALPVQAVFVPPVHIQSEVPQSKSSYHVEDWHYEWVNARGEVVEYPDLSLIPAQYILVDTKTIAATVKRTKNRTAIPGVRAFDAGAVRLKKRG